MPSQTRRAVLAALAAALAGCGSGSDGGPAETDGTRDASPGERASSPTDRPTRTPTDQADGTADPTATDTDSPTPTATETAIMTASIDAVEGSWPAPAYGPGDSQAAPDESAPDDRPGEAWRVDATELVSFAVADGRAYVLSTERCRALAAATGAAEWGIELSSTPAPPGFAPRTGPARVGDHLVVGVSGEVRALSPADGSQRWSATLPDAIEDMAVTDSTVFALVSGGGDNPGHVVAISLADGTERWRLSAADVPGPEDRMTMVAAGNEAVVATAYSAGRTKAFGVDPADGTVRWTGERRHEEQGLTVVDGVAYVGGYDGGVFARRATTGETVWDGATDPSAYEVAVDDQRVYALNGGRTGLDVFSVGSGDEAWTFGPGEEVAVADAVYLAEDGDDAAIVALDPETGERRWTLSRPDRDVAQLAVVDGALFEASREWLRALA